MRTLVTAGFAADLLLDADFAADHSDQYRM
jgi:hypothetical protein